MYLPPLILAYSASFSFHFSSLFAAAAISDLKMISDTPFDKDAWAQYRQQLRDLPSTISNPAKIVFPEPPTA